ncbi:glycine N-acyltransferase-like [Brachionichthys hirsutus]|uniref:glycine N-acyltransferase-like n=1 Tax=Brachionichthys hirsutus TaxID=412623 RepID=UPI00360531FA
MRYLPSTDTTANIQGGDGFILKPPKMIILKDLKHIILMKDMLQRELPHSISVLGGVMHILQNNLLHGELCVDSWPTFNTVIYYHQQNRFSSSSCPDIHDMCTFYTTNPESLRRLLLDKRTINWRSGLTFRDVPAQLRPLIVELASLHGLKITERRVYNTFIHQDPENIGKQKEEFPLPVSILDESHAELVDKHLTYGGSQDSINYIRACLRHLPNQCVMNENGQPVSWMLSDELSQLRMAFTLPENRRTGCFRALTLALVHRMSSMGLPIYCQIHPENEPSINIFTTLGFTACLENISAILTCTDSL